MMLSCSCSRLLASAKCLKAFSSRYLPHSYIGCTICSHGWKRGKVLRWHNISIWKMASVFLLLLISCSLIGYVLTTLDSEAMFRPEMEISFCHWPRPYPLSRISPEFIVYLRNGTKANFTIGEESEVNATAADLDRLGFLIPKRQVVFVVHGFRDIVTSGYMLRIKDGLLALGDFTVILTGWERGSYLSPFDYVQAASNIQTVGEVIAALAKAILNLDTFHGDKRLLYLYCIGHSLGAHVCGHAGLKAPGLFDRISGLDPAGPGFENCPTNPSLRPQSADCVDAIHTDGNYSGHIDPIMPHQGALRRWGFVDFYPNGGANQPGCTPFDNDFRACSHHRSVGLFIYSMAKPKGVCAARGSCRTVKSLPDRSCDQGGEHQSMGYFSDCHADVAKDRRRGGVFYVSAAASEPYC